MRDKAQQRTRPIGRALIGALVPRLNAAPVLRAHPVVPLLIRIKPRSRFGV